MLLWEAADSSSTWSTSLSLLSPSLVHFLCTNTHTQITKVQNAQLSEWMDDTWCHMMSHISAKLFSLGFSVCLGSLYILCACLYTKTSDSNNCDNSICMQHLSWVTLWESSYRLCVTQTLFIAVIVVQKRMLLEFPPPVNLLSHQLVIMCVIL